MSGDRLPARFELQNPERRGGLSPQFRHAQGRAGEPVDFVAPGSYSLEVRAPGYVPAVLAVDVRRAAEEIDVFIVSESEAGQAAFLRGVILGSEGASRRALVHVLSEDLSAIVAQTRSDNSGEFRIGPLPPGRYRVSTEGVESRWVSEWVRLEAGATAEVTLMLEHP